MSEKLIKFKGAGPGAKSIVLVGVHGDEQSGIAALENILPDLQISNGEVHFCYGNPKAIKLNKRFTETNLNRMFKDSSKITNEEKNSYEYKRAQQLKQYLNEADALLDVHCSFTPKSKPFLICESNSNAITSQLPIETVVYGFDEVEPGGTDYYMNKVGKIGICVETGYLGDSNSIKIAEESIYAFLKAKGHINEVPTKPKLYTSQRIIQMYQLYLTKTNDFKLSQSFADFEVISKGQLIGMDGNQAIIAPRKSIILFARSRSAIGEEAFLLGEIIS